MADLDSQTLTPKKCTGCGALKGSKPFHKINNICLDCHKERMRVYNLDNPALKKQRNQRNYQANPAKYIADAKTWAETHPQQRREIQVRSNRKLREETLAAYGGKCACCGESTTEFLAIDHINNNGAEHRRQLFGNRAQAGTQFYRWLRTQGFPQGDYQVLCANCNTAKAFYGICPHQRSQDVATR